MIDFVKFGIPPGKNGSYAELGDVLSHKTENVITSVDAFGVVKKTVYDLGDSLKVVTWNHNDKINHDCIVKNAEVHVSLHKYINGGFNHSDFSHEQLNHSVLSICKLFSVNPDLTVLKNLEYGVNVVPPIRSTELLANTMFFSTRAFNPMTNKYHKSIGLKAQLSDYSVKLYDKKYQLGNQVRIDDDLVRFELKYRKMRIPQSTGVYSLSDLLVIEKLVELGKHLVRSIRKLAIVDPTVGIRLPAKNSFEFAALNRWYRKKHIDMLWSDNQFVLPRFMKIICQKLSQLLKLKTTQFTI